MDRRSAIFAVCILALAGGAMAVRLPSLQQRPMHCDEANQAVRAGILLETGGYDYDPWDGHGPSLYWITLPILRLVGATGLAGTAEWHYRIVPVLFGAGLIVLLLLVSDGLGRVPAIFAGLLTAISPTMVYYSRYYIQEMLLVFFTFAAIACGWRYIRNPRFGWAIALGGCFGLMHATKETWILAAFAMAAGLGLTVAWTRGREGRTVALRSCFRPIHVLAAIAAAGVVATALYSSFGTNWPGPMDSIKAYATYFRRGGGGGDHAHAWDYYLRVLAAYWPQPRWTWTRWPMVGLAVLCWLAAIIPLTLRERAGDAAPQRGFCRFLALYTLILTAIYCVISYKTPWCLLSFLHGLILLAGVGAWALVRGPGVELPEAASDTDASPMRQRGTTSPPSLALRASVGIYRLVVSGLLVAGAARLGWECFLLNGKYSVHDQNSLVYNHTSLKVLDLASTLERLAVVSPEGHDMEIQVVSPEFWPLPWYFRRFSRAGFWEDVGKWRTDTAGVRPPSVLILAVELDGEVDPAFLRQYRQGMLYNLRPKVVLELCVREDLWQAYVQTAGG